MTSKPPLRVGLLLDSMDQPAWVREVIAELRSSQVAEIALVVMNAKDSPPRPSLISRLDAYRKALLYLAYMRLDAFRVRGKPDPFEPVHVADLLTGVETFHVKPRQTTHCDYFEDADIEAVRRYELDVVIRLGFRILKGEALRIARYGVWSFHHGDNAVNRGGPPGVWEVIEGHPATGAILQILSDDLDNGRVIYRSFTATNRVSVSDSRRVYFWKSAAFVGRKLRDLHARGEDGLRPADGDHFQAYSNRLYRQPTNAEMLRFLPRLVGRYATERLLDIVGTPQWFLAYKFGRGDDCLNAVPDGTLYNAKSLEPPADRFWADPFPVYRDRRYFVFFEEFLHHEKKGQIAVIAFDENGRPGNARVVLKTDHHLSYPTIFEWQRETYMLVESADSGRIQAYRCVQFPDIWEPGPILLDDVTAVDPTITEVDGRWWLFANLASPRAETWTDELHLFFADNPLGPWRPHSANPVKSDVRGARPAGRLFSFRGRLYRPAQDCSVRYGFGITIHQITRMTELAYEEVPVSSIRPDWRPGLLGVHTLNAAGRLTVTDGLQRRLFR